MVARNRDMLMAIAGVFFLLPSLAFAVVVPQPVLPAGTTATEAFSSMSGYYSSALPYLLIVTVLQVAGIMTLLIVMTDRARPTVGQAIAAGFRTTLPYLAAQLVLGFGFGIGLGIVMAIGAVSGVKAVATALTIAAMFVAVIAFLRFVLVAPILATGPVRNPFAVLRNSWAMTRGQVARMAVFFGLALLLYLVITSLIMMLVGVVLALTTEGEVQRVLAAAVSSGLSAVGLVYFGAMLAAVHRQLAGDGPDTSHSPG